MLRFSRLPTKSTNSWMLSSCNSPSRLSELSLSPTRTSSKTSMELTTVTQSMTTLRISREGVSLLLESLELWMSSELKYHLLLIWLLKLELPSEWSLVIKLIPPRLLPNCARFWMTQTRMTQLAVLMVQPSTRIWVVLCALSVNCLFQRNASAQIRTEKRESPTSRSSRLSSQNLRLWQDLAQKTSTCSSPV